MSATVSVFPNRSGRFKLLLVEDDAVLAKLVMQGLAEDGYHVEVAHSFAGGFHRAMQGGLHALILDVSLPDRSGIELAQVLRSQGVDIPILMLTSLGDAEAMVTALDSGADDYVVKPVALSVLGARLRALHRRWDRPTAAPIRVGSLVLEPSRLVAKRGDTEIDLTPTQARILETLMINTGNVLTRSQIAHRLHDDPNEEPLSNVIDVHIRALRSKVDDPFGSNSIETVRGLGYRLRRA